jgi:hypothetical protein
LQVREAEPHIVKGWNIGIQFPPQVKLATVEHTALRTQQSSGEQHAYHNHTAPPQ